MPWWGKKKDTCSGRLGDMSEEQEEALYEFKDQIESEQLTNDPRFDDTYLLRFLREKDFNVEKTMDMFREFIEWRNENNVDQAMVMYRFPELPEVREHYQHGYHKTDREGRPVWIDRPCLADIDACLHLLSPERMEQYYIAEYERLLHIQLPACSAAKGETVDSTFSIVDCKGFKMSMINKKTRNFLQIATKLGQNYYPQIMWHMYVINTPFVFKAVWAAIKPFLNEKSKKRIKILGGKYKKDLFAIVDPDNLPEEIGGNCSCEGGCFNTLPGPWDEYPGDEFGEAILAQMDAEDTLEKQTDLEEIAEPKLAKLPKSNHKKIKKKKKNSRPEESKEFDDVTKSGEYA